MLASVCRAVGVPVLGAVLFLSACSSGASSGEKPEGHAASSTTTEHGSQVETDAATDWALYGHDHANSRTASTEKSIRSANVAKLAQDWSIDGLVGVTGTPLVAEDVAYFDDWNGNVHAVDAATGTRRWTTKVGGTFVAAPALDDRSVFVAANHTLTALDRNTGRIRWHAETDTNPFAQISASPVVVDGLVIQGTASYENMAKKDVYSFVGSIIAYDTQTGKQVWRFATTPNDTTAGPGVGVWSTPAIDTKRQMLFVGTGQTLAPPAAPHADAILAIHYRTGKLAWSRHFTYPDVFSNGHPINKDADVGASPNLWTSNGRDLVGAGDKGGTFHALDRESGKIVWNRPLTPGSFLGGQIGSSAFVDGLLVGTSIVGDAKSNAPTDETKVFALDPASGKVEWSKTVDGKVFAPVSAVAGVAFVATDKSQLLALDTRTGKTLWTHHAPNQVAAGPSIVDGRVLWGYGFILFGGPGDGGVISFSVPK